MVRRQNEWDSNTQEEVLDYLLEEEGIDLSAQPIRLHRHATDRPSISYAQRRLWFLYQLVPDSPVYNISAAVKLVGTLDLTALHASLNEIVRRHEVLRTVFESEEDRPVLRILSHLEVDLPVVDLRNAERHAAQVAVRQQIKAESQGIFDLARGPLLRTKLWQISDTEHSAVLTLHHIVADAWSLAVLVRELGELYSAYLSDRPSPLGELPIQYGDFSQWQQEWLESGGMDGQLAYWKEQLRDAPQLEFPTDRPRPIEPTFRGATHTLTLAASISEALQALGHQENATLFMTLLAIFQVVLHRYSQQDDIIVGTPIANRNRSDIEPLIGFFVNSLALRSDFSTNPTFRELLRQTRRVALDAYANQDLPFECLVQEILPERDVSQNPLFQVLFSLDNTPHSALQLPGLTLSSMDLETDVAKFDLALNMAESASGLVGGLEYNTDLFGAETIARLAEHFGNIAETVAADPDQQISELPLLSESQRQQILIEGNATHTQYPRDVGIHRLFEQQAKQSPDAVAVEFGNQRLTYAELNARANQLAHYLKKSGVAAGRLVGVFIERSADMVAGLLGILKAGGAYVPLDTTYPKHRLAFMLEDCQVPVLLTQNHLRSRLPEHEAAVVRVDSDWELVARESIENPDVTAHGQLAYVIYTSGSTGVPKGVAVPHRAVNRLVRDTNYVQLNSTDKVAQASNASFDASTFEIWGALLNGARLVGVEKDIMLSPQEFADWLRQCGITTIFLTTALFNQMARDVPTAFQTLRNVLFGGEAVDPQWVRSVLQQGPPQRLLHVYGPTENTTFSTWHVVKAVPDGATRVPIGSPISNTTMYVLDRRLQPVPIGVPGELYLGGDGLARGYLNRPELTAEKFVPHPFSDTPGATLYKTGDIVRFLCDGTVEFLGRHDEQVKIRGFRIEPSEVEAVLLQHADVRASVVMAREDEPHRRQLVAYVVTKSDQTLEPGRLREFLRTKLPDYMIPSHFLQLGELPLTPNGKVNKRMLPAPQVALPANEHSYQPPRDEQESLLVKTYEAVLGRTNISIHDNYFELGGDSITAIQLMSRLKRAGWSVSVRELFQNPTIADLSTHLQPADKDDKAWGRTFTGPVPLTAIQRWFFERHHGELHHFNQALLLRPAQRFDEDRLREVLYKLQEHHDALRMTFSKVGEDVRQVNAGLDYPLSFQVIDLQDEGDAMKRLETHAVTVQQSIDLEQGPLMKAVLYRLPAEDRLLLVIHHLVVDAVSWRILLQDLQRGYQQRLAGKEIELAPKSMSFQAWSTEMNKFALSQDLLAELPYWNQAAQVAVPRLPREIEIADNLEGDSRSVSISLSEEETAKLLTRTHHAYNTEINDLLLVALGRALTAWQGERATWLTLEGHGRDALTEKLDLGRTVGWFTSLYPFLLVLPTTDIGEQIKHVKEALRLVPANGTNYGILRYVAGRDSADALPFDPQPQVSFNYLGQFDAGGEDGFLEFAAESTGATISPVLPRQHDLDFVALVVHARLQVFLTFHAALQTQETAARLLDNFKLQLRAVVDHCASQKTTHKTVSDFSGVSADDYESILKQLNTKP